MIPCSTFLLDSTPRKLKSIMNFWTHFHHDAKPDIGLDGSVVNQTVNHIKYNFYRWTKLTCWCSLGSGHRRGQLIRWPLPWRPTPQSARTFWLLSSRAAPVLGTLVQESSCRFGKPVSPHLMFPCSVVAPMKLKLKFLLTLLWTKIDFYVTNVEMKWSLRR